MIIRNLKRLISDEGKILRNTETGKTAYCVDIFSENVDKWEEVEEVKENNNGEII